MVMLLISEEYGHRRWCAKLTEDEYDLLIDRWESMRGLNCLVPVTLIIPQAVELMDGELPVFDKRCHIHEYDDSRLEGSDYRIPPDKFFWMDGICYEEYRV